jgi:hypothetical protein
MGRFIVITSPLALYGLWASESIEYLRAMAMVWFCVTALNYLLEWVGE